MIGLELGFGLSLGGGVGAGTTTARRPVLGMSALGRFYRASSPFDGFRAL